jgi:hypothetical protein
MWADELADSIAWACNKKNIRQGEWGQTWSIVFAMTISTLNDIHTRFEWVSLAVNSRILGSVCKSITLSLTSISVAPGDLIRRSSHVLNSDTFLSLWTDAINLSILAKGAWSPRTNWNPTSFTRRVTFLSVSDG